MTEKKGMRRESICIDVLHKKNVLQKNTQKMYYKKIQTQKTVIKVLRNKRCKMYSKQIAKWLKLSNQERQRLKKWIKKKH